jgi:predicted ATPase
LTGSANVGTSSSPVTHPQQREAPVLDSLTLKQFKTHRSLEVQLSPLTVLVGPNGCGKSTVLEALWCLGKLTEGVTPDMLFSGPRALAELRTARTAGEVALTAIGTLNSSPKQEAWVLHGFQPMDDHERGLLAELHRQLGFDPTVASDRLTASSPGAKKEPKRVLASLVQDDLHREASCWQSGHLELLRTRGEATGLTEFLREVAQRLAAVVVGSGT